MMFEESKLDLRQSVEALRGYSDYLQGCNGASGNIPVVQKLEHEIASFSEDEEQLAKLCGEICSVQAQRGTYIKLYEELCNSDDTLEELSAHRQENTKELDYGVSRQKSLFEKCFGLRFQLTQDKAVSLEFKHLSGSHLERTCSIVMDVSTEGTWQVVQVEPSISDVNSLLDQLNKTGNLSEFCKQVRLKFKQKVLGQNDLTI